MIDNIIHWSRPERDGGGDCFYTPNGVRYDKQGTDEIYYDTHCGYAMIRHLNIERLL